MAGTDRLSAQETAQEHEPDETTADGDPTDPGNAVPVPLTLSERASANKVTVAECMAFYRMVVMVATTFLGGTLLFIEKIAPHPVRWTLVLLLMGWVLLILAVLSIIWVRRFNIEAGRCYLVQDYDRSDRVQVGTRRLSTAAGVLLGLGMLFVMLFAFFNFWVSGVAGPILQ